MSNFFRSISEKFQGGTIPIAFVVIIATAAGMGFVSFIFFPWPITFLFFGIAVAAAALFENGWIDTEATNPPYQLARLRFGHYIIKKKEIQLEKHLGKRFFLLYGFMSTFKLFDMSQHQASLVVKDVKTIARDDKGNPITQSTGNTVEVLYVYTVNPKKITNFIAAAGEVDGEKTEPKHFSAVEKKLGSAISAIMNEICGNPDNTLITGWEDLSAKRDELAKAIAARLAGKKEGPSKKKGFSVLNVCGIELVRVFIADVKPDKDLEERQEQISLAKKQGEVNQAQAMAQAVRTKAYIDGMAELKNAGLSADDAASLYAAMNKDVPASTIFVRGGDKNNVAAAAILSAREEKPKPAKGGKP